MPKGIYIHKKATEETKRKMSLSHIGLNTWMKGRKFSDITRDKMSCGKKGKMPKNISMLAGWNKGLKGFNKGHIVTVETRQKIGKAKYGGENITNNAKHLYIIIHYGNPIKCEHCGKVGKKVNGIWNIDWANKDHTYSRIKEDYNGLCKSCHRKYDYKNNLKIDNRIGNNQFCKFKTNKCYD